MTEFFRRSVCGFAGSYPFAETWELTASPQQVRRALTLLNNSHLQLEPVADVALIHSYWQYFNLRYPDTGETAHAWLRPCADSTHTPVALVSISAATGTRRLLNRDFWYLENCRQVSRFESQVLKPLKARLDSITSIP